MTPSYDIENRQIQATNTNGTERYAYGNDNRRIYQKTTSGTELVFFYGVNGDRLRTYQLLASNAFQVTKTNIYFAGRLIWGDNTAIHVDRLGSVRNTSRYYPFGEEQGSGTIPDKFATYYRDSSTGLDYAWNRYYGSSIGRFTTPDPYFESAKRGNPQSWNRYAYVLNDPANRYDNSGLFNLPENEELELYDPNESSAFTLTVDVHAQMPMIAYSEVDVQFAELFAHNGRQFLPSASSGKKVRWLKEALIGGVRGMINDPDCGNFLIGTARKAYLIVAGKNSPDELSEGERSTYNNITTDTLMDRLAKATFLDNDFYMKDSKDNNVLARTEYNTGSLQYINFYNSFADRGVKGKYQTVAHEGVHLLFTLDDKNLANAAGVFKEGSNASADFQDEVNKHCK